MKFKTIKNKIILVVLLLIVFLFSTSCSVTLNMSNGDRKDTIFGGEKIVYNGFGKVPEMSKYNKAPTRKIERYIRDVLMENFGKDYFNNHRLLRITYEPESGVMLTSYGNYHKYYYVGDDGKEIVITVSSDSDYQQPKQNKIRSNDVVFDKENEKLVVDEYRFGLDNILKWQNERRNNKNKDYIEEVKIDNINTGDKISFGKLGSFDFIWTVVEKKDGVLTLCSDYTFGMNENNGFRRRIDSYVLNDYFSDEELNCISWTDDDCKFYVDYVEKYEKAFKNNNERKVIGDIKIYEEKNYYGYQQFMYGKKHYLYGEKGKYENSVLCCDENGNLYDAFNCNIPKRIFVNIKAKKVKRVKNMDAVETLKYKEYNEYERYENIKELENISYEYKNEYMNKWRNEYTQNDTRETVYIRDSEIDNMVLKENSEYKYINRYGKEQQVLDFSDENIKNLKAGDLIYVGMIDEKRIIFKVRSIENDIATLDSIFAINLNGYKELLSEGINSGSIYYLRDEFSKNIFSDEELKHFVRFNNNDVIANNKKFDGILQANQGFYVIFDKKAIEKNENKNLVDSFRREIKEVYSYCDYKAGNTNKEIINMIPQNKNIAYDNIDKFLPTIKIKLNSDVDNKYTYLPDLDSLNYYEKVIRKNKSIYYLLNGNLYFIEDYNGDKFVEKEKIKIVDSDVKMIMTNRGKIYYLSKKNDLYFYDDEKEEIKFVMDSVYELFKLSDGNICYYVDVNDNAIIKVGDNLSGFIYKYENDENVMIDSFENERKIDNENGSETLNDYETHFYNSKDKHSFYVNKYKKLVSIDSHGNREVIDKDVEDYSVAFSNNGIAYNKNIDDKCEAYYYNLNEIKYIKEGVIEFNKERNDGYFGVYEETGKGKSVLNFIDVPADLNNRYRNAVPAKDEKEKLFYDIIFRQSEVQVYYNVLYYMSDTGELKEIDDNLYGDVEYYQDGSISYQKVYYDVKEKKSIYEVYDEMKTLSPFSLNDGKMFLEEYRSMIRKKERKTINKNEK